MIEYAAVMLGSAVLFAVFSVLIYKGKTQLIHDYHQTRVTDHRFNVSSYDLPKVMEGEFRLILNPILKQVCEERLEELRQA